MNNASVRFAYLYYWIFLPGADLYMLKYSFQISWFSILFLLSVSLGCGQQVEDTHPEPEAKVQQQAAMKPLPRGASADSLMNESRPPINEFDTPYLFPHEHPDLPVHIADWLSERGYVIPQVNGMLLLDDVCPCNAIRGEFKKKGQAEWAVYCTNREKNCIFIFWQGKVDNFDIIEKQPAYINNETKFLDISIRCCPFYMDRATGTLIKRQYQLASSYIDTKLPPIQHDGILFGIFESGGLILYFYKDQWIVLPGGD